MKYLFCLIILAVVIILLMFLESFREFKSFKISRYKIQDENIPEGFSGFRIAVISDLHNISYGKDNEEIIARLEILKPNIVLLAGDMLTCRDNAYNSNIKTAHFIRSLSEIYPVYYGIGNHERGTMELFHKVGNVWNDYRSILGNKVELLSNNKIAIEKNDDIIYIYGVDIDRKYYKRLKKVEMNDSYLEEKLGKKSNIYSILIAHNPDYFENYAKWGADLTVSGHLHGGMVRIPRLGGVISPKLRLFPRYDYGLYEIAGKRIIISAGLGAHKPKLRVNNKPELIFIELENIKSGEITNERDKQKKWK